MRCIHDHFYTVDGPVMNAIFGTSMNTTNIQKVETNRFARADLESKLLMVDDDMDMNALPKTNHIKSIVPSECKMDVERKGVQSPQVQIYARFLCFGNGALTALHDRTDGFFCRQIVLTTNDKPTGREDDPGEGHPPAATAHQDTPTQRGTVGFVAFVLPSPAGWVSGAVDALSDSLWNFIRF